MDYRKFLNKKDSAVLPYLGGAHVHTEGRRLRLTARPEIGYHRFQIEGRYATALEAADPLDLADRPKLRGHYACGWLFLSGSEAVHLHLLPEDEPEPLGLLTGRRWHDGEVLFDAVDFDTEVEMEARLRLEEGQPLRGLKGVAPSLRHAYGWALVHAASRRLSVPVALVELGTTANTIADEGAETADRWLSQLAATRRERARTAEIQAAVAEIERRRAEARARTPDPEARVVDALENTGAELLSSRVLAGHRLEVAFRFRGQRFVTVVDRDSLHVYDAGVCLDGHDEELTLDSLPGVIREAIDTSQLVITRR